MRAVRSSDTRPELALRKALWRHGFRYRLGSRLPGRPDIVFVGRKVAVFVDGCFWHGCPRHYTFPRTALEYWAKKIRSNVMRDFQADLELQALGWSSVRVWTHELAEMEAVIDTLTPLIGSSHIGLARDLGNMASDVETGNSNPWWVCSCGSEKCRVLSCSEPGSLRLGARRRPRSSELICWRCGQVYSREVPRLG